MCRVFVSRFSYALSCVIMSWCVFVVVFIGLGWLFVGVGGIFRCLVDVGYVFRRLFIGFREFLVCV